MSRLFVALAVIALLAVLPVSHDARGRSTVTFTVDSRDDEVDRVPGDGVCRTRSGECTIRAALNEVGRLPSDGAPVRISIPAGEYQLDIDPPSDSDHDEEGGDLDVAGHTTHSSLEIVGAGAGRTVIDQQQRDRVLQVSWPEAVTISNLTLRGGRAQVDGGGLDNSAVGGLTLRAVEIVGNSARRAGGGIASGRPLTLNRSVVSDNQAERGGGAWLGPAASTITASTISGNTAENVGGGLFVQNIASLQVERSLIADNAATTARDTIPPYGGGIAVINDPGLAVSSTIRVLYSTIRGNSGGLGGGVYWHTPGTLTLEASLLAANTAWRGAAISASEGSLALVNSTLSGNAAEEGGALLRSAGTTTLRASTIAGNTATIASGLLFAGGRGVYATATGTIIANEPAAQNCSINWDSLRGDEQISIPGTNIESGRACGLGGSDRSDTDPRLGPLAANGGPTQTRALLPGSPALDRYSAGDCPRLDQRGFSRPVGAGCDIGAFERGARLAVDGPRPLRPRHDITGGRLTLTPPTGRTTSLRGGDYGPCTPGKRLIRSVAAGFFEPRDGQLATRGILEFRRNAQRVVRFGDLLVLLDGARGSVLTPHAPGGGQLRLFDVDGLVYGARTARGRLHLTAKAASVLNRALAVNGFRAGMNCGRLELSLRLGSNPGSPRPVGQTAGPPPPPSPPPPPPPPPPPQSFTLEVHIDPEGGGMVSSIGISCPGDCSETYPAGTNLTLEAAAAAGSYEFDNWDGACTGGGSTCSLTIDQDKSVTAKFKKRIFQCSDGKDNDNDGAKDFPADKGCTGPQDDDEK
jgi:hypothetical protein